MSPKNRPWVTAAAILTVGSFSAGCFWSGSADDADFDELREGLDEAAEGLGHAAEAMREAFGEMAEGLTSGGVVENPVSFRELRELLPEELGDFTRTSRQGSTEGAMGFTVSKVEARYEDGEGGRIDVSIADLGALPVALAMGMADWAGYEVDEESDRGWKRTIEYEGYPGLEEFRRSGDGGRGRAEFVYFVEQRFVVQIEGRNVSMDAVHDMRDEIGADDLADMKDDEGRRDRDRRDGDR